MNCLFCKQNTETSVSVEHIIPESLGNKDHVLPRGIVCDRCNNYFSLKVEKPLLELPYFKNVRHRAGIESKKGKIPIENAVIISPHLAKAQIAFGKDGRMYVDVDGNANAENLFKNKGALIIPAIFEPEKNDKIVSRFLAKVAVEALLYKLINEDGWIDEILNKTELEDIKRYSRFGAGVNYWPYHQRKLYSEETRFSNSRLQIENYEVLHEFNILLTKESYCYFVLVIMGIEYAINLAAPSIDGYISWLQENNNKSIIDDHNERKIDP